MLWSAHYLYSNVPLNLRRQYYVASQNLDGTRKLQHHSSHSRPGIPLSQGTGFFVENESFEQYRQRAKAVKQVRVGEMVLRDLQA